MNYQRLFLTIFLLLATSCERAVIHNLDELQANKVSVILAKAGIQASKVASGTGWEVKVPTGQVTRALQSLDQNRVLRKDLGAEANSTNSFIQSSEERAHQLERKTSYVLEQTLERLPGVLEARVHLHRLVQKNRFSPRTEQHDSASVLLISAQPESIEKGEVAALVAGASGVDSEKISVVLTTYQEPQPPELVEEGPAEAPGPMELVMHYRQVALTGVVLTILLVLLILRRSTTRKSTQALFPSSLQEGLSVSKLSDQNIIKDSAYSEGVNL